ncbi:MAG: 30S ribosomal protein S18, partial [Dehalococcoidia bacterium]
MRNNVRGKNKSFIPRVDKGRCCPLGGFDYKAVGVLKRYISDSGKIDSGKRSGNCAKCQRNLTLAIKRARHMALIPYASNHLYDTSLISLEKAKEEVSEPESEAKEEVSEPESEAKEEVSEPESEAKEEVS